MVLLGTRCLGIAGNILSVNGHHSWDNCMTGASMSWQVINLSFEIFWISRGGRDEEWRNWNSMSTSTVKKLLKFWFTASNGACEYLRSPYALHVACTSLSFPCVFVQTIAQEQAARSVRLHAKVQFQFQCRWKHRVGEASENYAYCSLCGCDEC